MFQLFLTHQDLKLPPSKNSNSQNLQKISSSITMLLKCQLTRRLKRKRKKRRKWQLMITKMKK